MNYLRALKGMIVAIMNKRQNKENPRRGFDMALWIAARLSGMGSNDIMMAKLVI